MLNIIKIIKDMRIGSKLTIKKERDPTYKREFIYVFKYEMPDSMGDNTLHIGEESVKSREIRHSGTSPVGLIANGIEAAINTAYELDNEE